MFHPMLWSFVMMMWTRPARVARAVMALAALAIVMFGLAACQGPDPAARSTQASPQAPAAVAAASELPPPSPPSQGTPHAALGSAQAPASKAQELFSETCAKCHAFKSHDAPELVGVSGRMSFEAFDEVITKGRATMPAHPHLSDVQKQELWAWLERSHAQGVWLKVRQGEGCGCGAAGTCGARATQTQTQTQTQAQTQTQTHEAHAPAAPRACGCSGGCGGACGGR